MAEHLLDHLDVGSACDGEAGGAVALLVGVQTRQADRRGGGVKVAAAEVVRPDRPTAAHGQHDCDMRHRTDRRRVYEILIREGLPQFMIRWLDGAFLIDLWDELDLPVPVREAWSPLIEEASSSKRVDVFSAFDHGPGGSPEVAPGARVRGFNRAASRRHSDHKHGAMA